MISRRCAVLALLAGAACNASGSPKGSTTVVPPSAPAEASPPLSMNPTDPAPMPSSKAPDFGVEPTDTMPARCNELGAQFEKIVPNVVVLVDRSKSMFEANGQPVRAQLWDPLEDALTNASDGVIPELQSEVRFGFVAYNRDADSAAACPHLQSVPVAIDNGATIATAYAAAGAVPTNYYKWDTPTAESVLAVTAQLTALPESGPKYILLVTDGNPDRCAEADPQCGQDDAIAAVQAAFAAGITTYVVGIGEVATAVNDFNVTGCWGRCGALHLQDLANAGIGLPVIRNTDAMYLSNCFNGTTRRGLNNTQIYLASYVDDPVLAGAAPFFAPTGRAALRDALSSILSGVRSCTFTLTEPVRTGKEGTGNVLLDGAPLVYGDPNGWLLSNGTDVQLQGTACTRLQREVESVEVFFPCEAYIR